MAHLNQGSPAPHFEITAVRPVKARLRPSWSMGSTAGLTTIIVSCGLGLWLLKWILQLPSWKDTFATLVLLSLPCLAIGMLWSKILERASVRQSGIMPTPIAWYRTATYNLVAIVVTMIMMWHESGLIRLLLFWAAAVYAHVIPVLMARYYRRLGRRHSGQPIAAYGILVLTGIAIGGIDHLTIHTHTPQPLWCVILVGGLLAVGLAIVLAETNKTK